MLSRASLQSHHNYNHNYLQNPDHLPTQPHLPSTHEQPDRYSTGSIEGNLQAGRKRRESELDSGTDQCDSNGNVRKRISRACDQCNQLRTKCDGLHPCAHCQEIGLQCEYVRAHKKRGRAPKKENDPEEQKYMPNGIDGQRPQTLARKYSNTSYISNHNGQEPNIPSNTTPTARRASTLLRPRIDHLGIARCFGSGYVP